ncbi:hypothetical protein FACS1894120_2570 [Clostridia bacterium]|nr:hypothetical protein FACS1894120_2570 [Clostridia bacterium]
MLPNFKKDYAGLTLAQALQNASMYGRNIDSRAEEDEHRFHTRFVFLRTRFWLLLYLTLLCLVTAGTRGVVTGTDEITGAQIAINYASAVCMALITGLDCFFYARGLIDTAKTERRLKLSSDVKFRAVRDHVLTLLGKTEIVPDDIIVLEEGESVPADGRILEIGAGDPLTVDESIFSGSGTPVKKQLKQLKESPKSEPGSAETETGTVTEALSRHEAVKRAEAMRRANANRKDFTKTIAGLDIKNRGNNTDLFNEMSSYTATAGMSAVQGDVVDKSEEDADIGESRGNRAAFRYIPKVQKNEGLLKDGKLLPHLLYKGTKIATGTVVMEVTAIGQDTLRSTAASDYAHEKPSAFENTVTSYMPKLGSIAVIVGVIVMIIGFLTFTSAVPPTPREFVKLVFLPAAVLALCFIPAEALLLTRRNYLGCIGRLAKSGVIARGIDVIEKLNAMTTLCIDKEGVITKSETELKAHNAENVDLLTNISVLSCPKSNSGQVSPIEKAIKMSATFRNLSVSDIQDNVLVREYPFAENSTESRFGGNLWYIEVEGGEPQMLLCVKGAPEDVFSSCKITPENLYAQQLKQQEYSTAGYQTIAVACAIIHKKSEQTPQTQEPEQTEQTAQTEQTEQTEQPEQMAQTAQFKSVSDRPVIAHETEEDDIRAEIDEIGDNERRRPQTIEELYELYDIPDSIFGINLIPVGLMAFAQDIRTNVPIAVKKCYKAGVTLRLMTGESREPAMLTARRAGLRQGVVITGDQLKNDIIPPHVWEETNVFARVSQAQRLKIVEDLQNLGEIVGVFSSNTRETRWDAVLDKADLSIVMSGASGTQIESANLIVGGDSFGELVKIISICRLTHRNIKAGLSLILSSLAALVLYSSGCLIFMGGGALTTPLVPALLICFILPVAAGFCVDSTLFEDEAHSASAFISRGTVNKKFIFRAGLQAGGLLGGAVIARLLFSEKGGAIFESAYTGGCFAALTAGVCAAAIVNLSETRGFIKTLRAVGQGGFTLLSPVVCAVLLSVIPVTGAVLGTGVSGVWGGVRTLLAAFVGGAVQVWLGRFLRRRKRG